VFLLSRKTSEGFRAALPDRGGRTDLGSPQQAQGSNVGDSGDRGRGTETETEVNTAEMWSEFLEKYGIKGVYGTEMFFDALMEEHARELSQEIFDYSQARIAAIDDDDIKPSDWDRHDEWCNAGAVIHPDYCKHLRLRVSCHCLTSKPEESL
jgi:hypothetical protein